MVFLPTKVISLLRGILVPVLAAFALTGCVTMAVESDFNEDGSATHSIAITFDTSMLGSLGEGIDTEQVFEGLQDQADLEGYRVENISEGDVIGVRVTRDVENTENLGQILNELLNAGTESSQEVAPFSGTFERDGDDYRLELSVDGSALSQGVNEGMGSGETAELDSLGFGLDQILEMTYTAHLPGEVDADETSGTVNDDGSVTWTLPLSGQETLVAQSSSGGDSNLAAILLIAGLIVLGLIVLAIVGFVLFKGRRTRAEETPSAPSQAPQPAPATDPAWTTDPDQPTRPIPGQETGSTIRSDETTT